MAAIVWSGLETNRYVFDVLPESVASWLGTAWAPTARRRASSWAILTAELKNSQEVAAAPPRLATLLFLLLRPIVKGGIHVES